MPKAKRSPIDYTPQFGAGIFRPKEMIAQELASLQGEAASDSQHQINPADLLPMAVDMDTTGNGNAVQRRTGSERTNERTNEHPLERTRVRHSFDIWQDQLLALSNIQAERFNRTGRKPKLGELVQEALDVYVAKERDRTNVRTNER